MQRATQDGLEWQESFLDLEPVWTREPSIGAIESVSRQQLKITSDNPCTVTFHGAGFFNKVYLVRAEVLSSCALPYLSTLATKHVPRSLP